MRREVIEVVESARDLQVRIAPRPGNPDNVRIAGDRNTFPTRLRRVALSVEAFDRAGGASMDTGGVDPSMDAAKLRLAMDGVFRWMRSVGMDVSEPHALVANALGVRAKAAKGPKPVPNGPAPPRPTRLPPPLLRLAPGPGEVFSMAALRERALRIRMVEASLGAASVSRGR